MLSRVLRALAVVAPWLAGRLALALFCTPISTAAANRSAELRAAEVFASAERFMVQSGGRSLAAYSWGTGPAVLLVHGWAGRATQFRALVGPLTEAGFRAVAIDLPAHGRSPGRMTNGFEFAQAVEALAERTGGAHAVIAHSLGALSTSIALAHGLSVRRAVYLAPFVSLDFGYRAFARELCLSARGTDALRRAVERRFGDDIWARAAADVLIAEVDVPALIVHDADDPEVPLEEGTRLAESWSAAELMITSGLGHRRVLRDPDVLSGIVKFIGP
ncbi:MAG TPA: alpha/beta fold hydrolase [Egibacteraceae bacterium]|nr:alpha/beta fold hydrolase [Egibacteraceae bacterium]